MSDTKFQQALKELNKRYGDGAVLKLNKDELASVPHISTGVLTLDMALGIGGLPKGRIIEIYGNPSSGKTTLCGHIIAEAQKEGGKCIFIDVEHALDPQYFDNLGVNTDELYVSQPASGEEALNICETFARIETVAVIVVDSVAALTPQAEIDGEMGDSHIGLQARLMSQALRKLAPIVSETNCLCIFTNQLREKVGIVYGNPEVTSGGRALPFYASVRLDVRKRAPIKQGTDIIGNEVRVKITKNKVAPPYKEALFNIMYGKGVDTLGCLVDKFIVDGIIEKRGAWFYYGETKLGQGKANAIKLLKDNPELLQELKGRQSV